MRPGNSAFEIYITIKSTAMNDKCTTCISNGIRDNYDLGKTDTTVTRTVIEFKKGQSPNLDSLKKYRACGIELGDYYDEGFHSPTRTSWATFNKDVTISINVDVK